MRLRVQQVNVPLQYTDTLILQKASRTVGCQPSCLSDLQIVRRSLDARARNPEPLYVLTIEVTCSLPTLPQSARPSFIEILNPENTLQPEHIVRAASNNGPRPVVVGAGPAGLMAAYHLALAGTNPLLIERGDSASERAPHVARFWNAGILDPESNVLYGEGGAGLFSDGKLTARSKERGRIRSFMQVLHDCGADESVLIDAEPHIGSDRLLAIVPRLRERIIAAGGEVCFRTRLDDLITESGRIRGIVANGKPIECHDVILAVGHSARDVYALLARKTVALQSKPFAVGLRLEIPQRDIDRAQYGRFSGSPLLGAASFRLTRREENGIRACYSFCMCPGGKVISCASESGYLTTNGMSYSKRSLGYGNAAFLVPVGPADYPQHAIPAFGGIAFQRQLEQAAFAAAGDSYAVPASRLVDFLAKRTPTALPGDCSCPRPAPVNLWSILPDFIAGTLAASIPSMLKELNGVKYEDAILYAPETRSSSPLWITRGPDCQSVNTAGLYPVGEGAGYAGGIVSSAIDGIRAAEHLLANRCAKG